MVGVREDNLSPQRLQITGRERFDCAGSADRHERGRVEFAITDTYSPGAGAIRG
jgi:hypothetical protein